MKQYIFSSRWLLFHSGLKCRLGYNQIVFSILLYCLTSFLNCYLISQLKNIFLCLLPKNIQQLNSFARLAISLISILVSMRHICCQWHRIIYPLYQSQFSIETELTRTYIYMHIHTYICIYINTLSHTHTYMYMYNT
jgi:hypothetical protein